MEIRILEESDAAEWWQLRLEALEREPFAFGMAAEDHRLTNAEATARPIREARPAGFYLGAFEEGRLIGTAIFIGTQLYRDLGFETFGTEPHALKIGSTYLDEDHMILRIR